MWKRSHLISVPQIGSAWSEKYSVNVQCYKAQNLYFMNSGVGSTFLLSFYQNYEILTPIVTSPTLYFGQKGATLDIMEEQMTLGSLKLILIHIFGWRTCFWGQMFAHYNVTNHGLVNKWIVHYLASQRVPKEANNLI